MPVSIADPLFYRGVVRSYLYDGGEVGRGEGRRIIVHIRDVDVDQRGGGHRWNSTVQSSDGQ